MSVLKAKWEEGCKPRFSEGDAGLDLRAHPKGSEEFLTFGEDSEYTIIPGQVQGIPTGLKIEFPEGYCGLIFPRSSTGRAGLEIANTVPVIDNSFTGEITVFVTSRTTMTLKAYERFAQIVLVPYYQVSELEYGEPRETERGDGSFGSTGSF